MKLTTFTILAFLFSTNVLFAQWTTSGNDIQNTNIGEVKLGGVNCATCYTKLNVSNGDIKVNGTSSVEGGQITLGKTIGGNTDWAIDVGSFDRFRVYTTPNSNTSGIERLVITSNGNVGIGVSNPDASYKLHVCGGIRAKEVKVETGWCDYVFEPNYCLPNLQEVKAYTNENKHLPDVTSAKEIESEGLSLGSIASQMIRKIEELYLYLFAQQDDIDELKKENAAQKVEIESLKAEMQAIKADIAKLKN